MGQIGSIFIRASRLIPFKTESAIMKQKGDSQEKQCTNKTDQSRPHGRSVDSIYANERLIGALGDCSVQCKTIPIESCLNCAKAYDPDVDYTNVLASLLHWLEARDEERTARQAQYKS